MNENYEKESRMVEFGVVPEPKVSDVDEMREAVVETPEPVDNSTENELPF